MTESEFQLLCRLCSQNGRQDYIQNFDWKDEGLEATRKVQIQVEG